MTQDAESVAPYYDHAGITIYHGDCRGILAWQAADVLVTDPPYGVALESGWAGLHGTCAIRGDDDTSARDAVLDAWGAKPAIVFGVWRRPRPDATKAVLVWDKGGHAGMGDLSFPWKPNWEEVYVLGSGFSGPRTSGVLKFYIHPTFNATRHHPTEKPISLLYELLGKCPPGVIADPFMGSGTTLVAAKSLGRRAIGVEVEERFCEIAAKRLSQEVLDFGETA